MTMKKLPAILVLLYLFAVSPGLAQTDNTFYVKNFAGKTVGQKAAAAQSACNANTLVPCVIVFDPTLATYAQGIMPQKCAQCIWRDYRTIAGQPLMLTGGTLAGSRNQNLANYLNPEPGLSGNATTIANIDNYFATGATSSTNHFTRIMDNQNLILGTPGCAGFSSSEPCYNISTAAMATHVFNMSSGTTFVDNSELDHWGTSDSETFNVSVSTLGGQSDGGGPEGSKIMQGYVTEPSNSYEGTIISSSRASDGSTTLSLSCTEDCGVSPYAIGVDPLYSGSPATLGQGQYVLDEQTPTASGQIISLANGSGETPGTLTVNITSGTSNLAVSTCYGTLASAVAPVPNPTGSGTASVTFTLNLEGSGDCVVGQIMSFAGFMHDQGLVTAVGTASGGQQQITVAIRKSHEAGSYAFENAKSDAGLFADVIADNVSGVQFPFDILGVQSISGSTAVLWYRWFYGGLQPGNDNLPNGNLNLLAITTTSLSNSGGIVTIKSNALTTSASWLNSTNIYISNASNPAFDGVCTGTQLSLPQGTLTCTQSASTGDTGTTATVTLTDAAGNNPYGNSDVNFYQGAMVVDAEDLGNPIVMNGQNLYPVDGKQFVVEANAMPLSVGDGIVEGHNPAMESHLIVVNNTTLNPMAYTSQGISLNFTGISQSGGASYGGSDAAFAASNTTNPSYYSYFGGTQKAPNVFFIQGQWDNFLLSRSTPDPFQSILNVVGCPATSLGCADPNYWYGVYSLQGNGKTLDAEYTPSTNSLLLNGTRIFNTQENLNSDTAFNIAGPGFDEAIGFGGRTSSATAQYLPMWGNGATATAGDLVQAANCDGSTECGISDTGVIAADVVRTCGTATFSSSATSASLACAWVTPSSHCQATWIGNNVSGGAIGFTASSGSVTLTAAVSNSGKASVACSSE
jgi:hypothetical protein